MDPRASLLTVARALVPAGLAVGTAGNLSVLSDDGTVVVTPSAVPYDVLAPDDFVVLDPSGAVILGDRSPTTEWALHLACYRARPDVRAVLHTHPPYATAFAAVHKPLPVVIDEMVLYAGGEVPCAAYAPSGSAELGAAAVAALGQNGSVLLANHGLLTVDLTLEDALHQACVVEHAARVALGAALLGGAVAVPEEAVAQFAETYRRRARSLPTT